MSLILFLIALRFGPDASLNSLEATRRRLDLASPEGQAAAGDLEVRGGATTYTNLGLVWIELEWPTQGKHR